VAEWSRVWVEQRGRPAFDTELRLGADGRIARLALRQSDGWGRNLIWPQRLRVVLGYANREESLPVLVEGAVTDVAAARGRNRPLYVLPNGDGLGYGRLLLDPETLRYLLSHIEDIQDELTRGSAWVDLWDNLLEARIAPSDFINLAVRALPWESNEQNTELVLGYLTRAFWLFLPQSERLARAPGIEELLRQGISRAPTASEKSAWFSAFRDVALPPDWIAWLERLWRREEKIEGLPFAETDEIPMAFELAVREAPGWQRIMEEQRDRTQDPDRKARFEFVMPALSADPAARERAFERFLRVDNRRREPWVIESLGYLHHPLREP
jgi:aminopeptidase N